MPKPKLVHVGWMPWGSKKAPAEVRGPWLRWCFKTKRTTRRLTEAYSSGAFPEGIKIVKMFAEVPSND